MKDEPLNQYQLHEQVDTFSGPGGFTRTTKKRMVIYTENKQQHTRTQDLPKWLVWVIQICKVFAGQ